MAVWKYSFKTRDETRIAKAVLKDVPVHPKVMYEVMNAIRGKKLDDAINFLEKVIEKKEAVPFRRYSRKQAHRRGLGAKWGWPAGRYPVKAASYVLKLLRNAENNADVKGLDIERLKIIHAAAHKGMVVKRWMPRAYGRSSPKYKVSSHIEVVVQEV